MPPATRNIRPRPRQLKPETSINACIGARIRVRRLECDITQAALGEKIGVTYQTIHKYERGEDRIAAARLKLIADHLKVQVSWFYETSQPIPAEPGGKRASSGVAA